MKLEVIGWTEYDNTSLEEGVTGWAAIHAITDDILKNGYRFTGEEHQEHSLCAPVLNDGKIRRMTQRGWGRLMADALGHRGIFDYSPYTYAPDETGPYPPESRRYSAPDPNAEASLRDIFGEDFDPAIFLAMSSEIAPEPLCEEELRERICIPDATLEQLEELLKSGKLTMRDNESLRYLDSGDIITLRLGDTEFSFIVSDVNRERDLTKTESKLVSTARYYMDERVNKRANEIFSAAPDRIIITAEFTRTDDWPRPEPTEAEGSDGDSDDTHSRLMALVNSFLDEESDDSDDDIIELLGFDPNEGDGAEDEENSLPLDGEDNHSFARMIKNASAPQGDTDSDGSEDTEPNEDEEYDISDFISISETDGEDEDGEVFDVDDLDSDLIGDFLLSLLEDTDEDN